MQKKKKVPSVPGRTEYDVDPCPKPRQTKRDVWQKRPCVIKYRFFADRCRALKMKVPESGAQIIFILPMPKSWSKKKRLAMDGLPHQIRPDIDNLGKSVFDAIHKDDSHIYDIRLSKFWGEDGKIVIK